MIRLLPMISFLFLFGVVVSAQTVVLKGVVTDTQGAFIPGAKVQLTSSDSRSLVTSTNTEGKYEIQVEPGKYHLSFIVYGFKPFEVSDFVVISDKINRSDVALKPQSDAWIDDLPFVPEPMEFVLQKPDLSLQTKPRPLQGMSRYCGTVRDEQGATIPAVFIVVEPEKRSKTGSLYGLKSDADGKFDSIVIDGLYKITFRRESFKKVELRNQLLPSDPNSCSEIRLRSSIPPHQIT